MVCEMLKRLQALSSACDHYLRSTTLWIQHPLIILVSYLTTYPPTYLISPRLPMGGLHNLLKSNRYTAETTPSLLVIVIPILLSVAASVTSWTFNQPHLHDTFLTTHRLWFMVLRTVHEGKSALQPSCHACVCAADKRSNQRCSCHNTSEFTGLLLVEHCCHHTTSYGPSVCISQFQHTPKIRKHNSSYPSHRCWFE
ncbi:hypothetical protein GGR50DRAFT_191749 [Xylaria sp. CBS 124048]|nr:hypothetical protein GGR50DRAFT_191749 [Xylaria sp. CBS 124048]